MSGETTQRSGFDMKSAQLPVVAFALRSTDAEQLAREFSERFGNDSELFDNDPVLIDLVQVRDAETPIDFAALTALLRQYRTMPVAVRGGNAQQMQAAREAGLIAAPEAPPARAAAAEKPAVREVIHEVEVVKEVQLPAKTTVRVDKPMRSGQQVYAAGSDVVVNAVVSFGAEVIADGNVHVYGPLRGRAVAGARGDTSARIYCTCFEPQLVSIAGIYRTVESDLPPDVAGKPAMVRLDGEKLLIEPL
ncbi:septum site-determining protein MinC [Comamonas odontotermitis]|uniref:Probable septum site-determining protein MinC n=1 Tax=Comamonas odontotermitis TaxID=379895 RepID=A0ABR6RBR0_9BURK|nr:septum site-determining protein MinC [Comamonas odontotermitis]MBB6576578.1 septum site-determining protein MinC [Comamonas odontotermitis]